jgi:hypothetical protein
VDANHTANKEKATCTINLQVFSGNLYKLVAERKLPMRAKTLRDTTNDPQTTTIS